MLSLKSSIFQCFESRLPRCSIAAMGLHRWSHDRRQKQYDRMGSRVIWGWGMKDSKYRGLDGDVWREMIIRGTLQLLASVRLV